MIKIIQVAQADFKKGLIVNPDNTIDVSFEGSGEKNSASRADHRHSYSEIVGAPSFGDAPLTFSAIQDGVGLQLSTREGKDVIDVKVGVNGIVINQDGQVDLDNKKLPIGNYEGTADDIKRDIDAKLSTGGYSGTAKNIVDSVATKLEKGTYTGTAQNLKEDIDTRLIKGSYDGTAQDLKTSIDEKLERGNYNGTAQTLKDDIDTKLSKTDGGTINGKIILSAQTAYALALRVPVEGTGQVVQFLNLDGDNAGYIGIPNASSSLGVKDLELRSYGNLKIYPSELLTVSNNSVFEKNITVTGTIYSNSNVTAYSDKRLKSNIEKIENPLDKLELINGYTFDMHGERKAGVIAQEVKEVMPEVVKEMDNGYLAVCYAELIPLLLESIKELKKEVDELKCKVVV